MTQTDDDFRNIVKNAICHVSSPGGFNGILATGAILPNDGRFELSYPQSAKSYAMRKHAVALFDFESAEPQQMAEHWFKCETFFRRYSPATYVLLLDRALLPGRLIRYDEATAEFGHGAGKIPYLEVWSTQPVPRDAITDVIVIWQNRFRRLPSTDVRLTDAKSLVKEFWPESTHSPLLDLTKLSDEDLAALYKRLEKEPLKPEH